MEHPSALPALVQGSCLQNDSRLASGISVSEGDIVSVKVLKSLGGGMYAVSLRGARISVRSEQPLSVGTVFRARVFHDGAGRILLKTEAAENAVRAEPVLPDGSPSALLADRLAGQGFIPDAVTVRIVQFLSQSGAKIDRNIIRKARSASFLFPGKEADAAEIASVLLKKGISPSEESIAEILQLLEGHFKDEEGFQGGTARDQSGEDENEGCFLKKVYDVLPAQGPGMLALVNQLRSKDEQDRHWIVLPFEWRTGEKSASGLIRILLPGHLQPAEKIQISCEFECKKYYFVLYLNKDKVKEVRFCTLPPLLTSCIHSEEKRLGELFCSGMNGDSVPVTYSALAFSGGLCASQELPFSFEAVSV